MPIPPVWWLDDQEAAALDPKIVEDIVDLTSKHNKDDQRKLNSLKKKIDPLLP